MNDDQTLTAKRRKISALGAGGLLAAGAIAGGIFAATLPASAATTPTASSAVAPSTETPPVNNHSATSQRAGEVVLTGSDLAKAKAAALAAVPGATIYRAETDADGAVYEVHLTKSDGTDATVKLDASFAVTAVQAGMGSGGPGAPSSSSAGA